ncbi:acyltransferase family protein [Tsukamurella sp. 8F]|uniref:acyltransferase family protein n=1 Tax=unclassified Tsukamurella TaxID=2633480 RepID=UPI0023B9247A|nr:MULTISPECIES: acyltransferase family protein [unclassified Tsukamurella]MDF0531889.1 acyltransferase family protein [Tsukamurella sp. 8J]MDF0589123.1 acyltransferase family protein [Tsukamurella sp. 8F]
MTMSLLPSRTTVVAGTPAGRDRAVDVARLASLLVVMLGHCALLLATVDGDGVHIANLLGALPGVDAITWVLQVMPLFFLAGGAAGAYGYTTGNAWGAWLMRRGQRLLRPVFWYLLLWAAALCGIRLVLGPESAAAVGQECVALLWFLGVYVVVLAFVPALCRMRSARCAAAVVAALLVLTAAFDGLRISQASAAAGMPNLLIVWLIPAAIGVAYARRLITVRVAACGAVTALTAQVALAIVGPYDLSLVVTGAEHVSNVSPPTLLLALHCVWMSLGFVMIAGPLRRLAARPRLWYAVAVGNGGAMTLYLWHIPVIALAAFALHYLGSDAYEPHASGFWPALALREAVFAVLMFVAFLSLSPLEHRRLPWWDRPSGGAHSACAGVLLVCAGVALLLTAKSGLGTVTGWESLAAFLILTTAARICAR